MVARRRGVSKRPYGPSSTREIYCHPHAVDRFTEHHPCADFRDLLRAWDDGEPISSALAQTLAGRKLARTTSCYRIAAGGRGILVVAPRRGDHGRPWVLVTYLRFEAEQRDLVAQWW